jgi:hypothetical protein
MARRVTQTPSAVDAVVVGCPTTSPWAVAPPLARGPTQETAAVAVGGKLYVLGGFDERGAVLADVQIFDPATCAWSAGPSLPAAVHHANAAVVDGTIYVVGAMMTISFRAIGDVWALTPGGRHHLATADGDAGRQRARRGGGRRDRRTDRGRRRPARRRGRRGLGLRSGG